MQVEGLPQLQRLQASHNRIRGVAPICSCKLLEDVWLQENSIADLPQVSASAQTLTGFRFRF